VGKRVKILERKLEVKERKERRKNVIIKGVEVKDGKRKEAVEEMIGELGIKKGDRRCMKIRERDSERKRNDIDEIERGETEKRFWIKEGT